MLSAYSCVGAVLEDKALLERAVQAANFLKENLWDAERQTVLRSCYRGEDMELQQISPPISGFLDDYAFLVSGLLDLYEASLQTQWLQWAEQLQLRQDVLFWDQQDGGYFCSDPNDTSILLQLKKDQDGAEPSANSVSASNLLRLSHYMGRHDWLLRSEQLLAAFSDRLQRVPVALPEMVQALMAHHYTLREIVICGQREAPDTLSLLSAVHSLFLPHKIPLAEMEALSLGSEKSWSLNLTEDLGPGDSNPFFISSQECNEEQLDPEQPLEENLLSVRKPAVVRTHSLPNDSYMFENTAPPDQIIAQNQGPQHTGGPHRNQSGTERPEDLSQLRVPADFFRPISPHSLSDSECIPRLPPPRRTHTLSRTLRRQ
ncbi:Spermatogenesis-associated protein 20, partial [Dissostichus eleginoides]